jgi:hypothetical protein
MVLSQHQRPPRAWRDRLPIHNKLGRPHFNARDDSDESDDTKQLEPKLERVSFSHRGLSTECVCGKTRTKTLGVKHSPDLRHCREAAGDVEATRTE